MFLCSHFGCSAPFPQHVSLAQLALLAFRVPLAKSVNGRAIEKDFRINVYGEVSTGGGAAMKNELSIGAVPVALELSESSPAAGLRINFLYRNGRINVFVRPRSEESRARQSQVLRRTAEVLVKQASERTARAEREKCRKL